VVEHAGGVVEDITVELTGGNDNLERVTEWALADDHDSNDVAKRTPESLSDCQMMNVAVVLTNTYSSDTLHAEDECILGQVSGVRESVFLPQLTEQSVQ